MRASFDARDEFGNFEANVRFLERAGGIGPGVRVLEIGSGKGRMLRHLCDLGCDARGVEINPWMIEESRRLHGPLPVERSDGAALRFPDAAFDAVLSFDVFEHIADSDAHLREVRRVLRPGGCYLLQTPNRWTNTVFETIRWRSFTAWRADHCALHTARQLRRRLRRHGFTPAFYDVPVVTDFFRRKVRRYLGPAGLLALRVLDPDRLPLTMRTNFYVKAVREERGAPGRALA